jgi:queuine/archaeosine tRNA-ribosyltransferase
MSRFHYVPAALSYVTHGGAGIYVRHGNTGATSCSLIEKTGTRERIRCPDRDLLIVRDDHHDWAHRPINENYDEFISLSPFFPSVELGTDYFMVNYVQMAVGDKFSGLNTPPKRKVQVIADSGGFQMGRGVVDYIDPVAMAKWYNNNANIGMVLDIPPGTDNVDYVKRLASLQARNTKILMEHKSKDVTLWNVVHGWTTKMRKMYRDKVDRDDLLDGLAVPGMYSTSFLNGVHFFLHEIYHGRKYRNYHALGVTNFMQLIPLMLIGKLKMVESITSDSSTAVQAGGRKEYCLFKNGTLTRLTCKELQPHLNPYRLLPCACAICSRLKYADVFRLTDSLAGANALKMHNQFTIGAYISELDHNVSNLSDRDLRVYLRKFGKRNTYDEMLRAIDYVQAVKVDGFEKANKQFRYYLSPTLFDVANDSTLFSAGRAWDVKQQARLDSIMTTYANGGSREAEKMGKSKKNSDGTFRMNKSKKVKKP